MKYDVINSGYCGHNSRDILLRLDDILGQKPDMIILMVGSNDFLNSYNSLSEAEYAKNLETIICNIKNADIELILMTLPPCYSPYVLKRHPESFFTKYGPDEKICEANAIIRGMSQKYDVHLTDINRMLASKGNIGTGKYSFLRNVANSGDEDGLHLTAAGYRIIASGIYNEINDRCNIRKIICLGDSITYGIHMKGAGTSDGTTYPAYLSKLLNHS